jgi:hypothetical protein
MIRGRVFDTAYKFLPDGLSKVDALAVLRANEKPYLSQIPGRTSANILSDYNGLGTTHEAGVKSVYDRPSTDSRTVQHSRSLHGIAR